MISLSQKIGRNAMAMVAGNLANKVIGFFIMLSVARFLGAEQFGLYTFVFAYVGFFGLLTDLGLTTVVARGRRRAIACGVLGRTPTTAA